MEVFYASERFRKSKKRKIIVSVNDISANNLTYCFLKTKSAQKRENKRFCQRHKREKEKINVSVNDISVKKRK